MEVQGIENMDMAFREFNGEEVAIMWKHRLQTSIAEVYNLWWKITIFQTGRGTMNFSSSVVT